MQEIGGADKAVGGLDSAGQQPVAAERAVVAQVVQLFVEGRIVGHHLVLGGVVHAEFPVDRLHDGGIAAGVLQGEMAAEFLASCRGRYDGQIMQRRDCLVHRPAVVQDPLGPEQVRDSARAARRREARGAQVQQVRGQAALFTASVVPQSHMLSPTTPNRDSQVASPAALFVPSGTATAPDRR